MRQKNSKRQGIANLNAQGLKKGFGVVGSGRARAENRSGGIKGGCGRGGRTVRHLHKKEKEVLTDVSVGERIPKGGKERQDSRGKEKITKVIKGEGGGP